MQEIRLRCLCTMIRLSDLGITLHQGDVVYVGVQDALRSNDLALAVHAGGVDRQSVERCIEQRPQGTVLAPGKSADGQGSVRRNPTVPPAESRAPQVDVDALADRIRSGIRADLGEMLRTALAAMPVIPMTGFAVPNVTAEGTITDGSTPRFIPQDLVRQGSPDISVESVHEQGAQVEVATAALRGMRKRPKRSDP